MQTQQSSSGNYNSAAIILATVLSLLFLSPAGELLAQPLSPSREIIFRSANWETQHVNQPEDSSCTLGRIGAWGSAGHGFHSASDNYGWAIDVGAIIELWRSYEVSIIAETSMELTARTNNNIYFNPNGGIWEAGLLWSVRRDDHDFQIGYLHRCSRNINNGDTTELRGTPAERTLIYGSFTYRYLFHPINLAPKYAGDFFAGSHDDWLLELRQRRYRWSIAPWIITDLYVFKEDYRQPSNASGVGNDYHNILASLGLGAMLYMIPILSGDSYLRAGTTLTAFGEPGNFLHSLTHPKSVVFDGLAELGYLFEGPAARFQIFIALQSFGDDLSTSPSQNSRFVQLGVRLSGLDMVE